MNAIVAAFESVGIPDSTDSFQTTGLEGHPGVLVGRDASGHPTVMIPLPPSLPGQVPDIRHLRNLTLQHGVTCTVDLDGSVQTGLYTILTCTSEDTRLRLHFLGLATSLLSTVSEDPAALIEESLDAFAELFEGLQAPSRRTVQGTWGELLVIARSSDVERSFRSWHDESFERYDFAEAANRLEVKTAGGRVRKHHFSLEQLQPVGATVVVVSILMESSSGGCSINDLVDQIKAFLPRRLHLELDHKVASSLGDDWEKAESMRFDRELAEGSLAFYRSSDIPSIDAKAFPAAISGVSFVVDLTNVSPCSAPPAWS